jgi:RNA polymerase sigma-70 factor (ECF subfamily)
VSRERTIDKTREPGGPGGVRTGGEETPELLAAIRRGDAVAFDQVAREHAPRLFRMALRLTGRREEAEDLVQETLLKTLPALRGFEARSRLSTYLIRALGNLWKNRLRSKKRSRWVEWFRVGSGETDRGGEEPNELTAIDPAPSAEERLEARDRAEQVRRAVVKLEPTRRLTLLLREVEELSYEEIASQTGVPVGTVRSRLARARRDLRQLIGETS